MTTIYAVKVEDQEYTAHFTSIKKALGSLVSLVNGKRTPPHYVTDKDFTSLGELKKISSIAGSNIYLKGSSYRIAVITKINVL